MLILEILLWTSLIPFWPKVLANFSLFLLVREVDYGVKYFSGTNLFSYKEYSLGPVCLSAAGINKKTQRSRPLSSQPSTLKLFFFNSSQIMPPLFALDFFLLPSFALSLLLSHTQRCSTKIQYKPFSHCIFILNPNSVSACKDQFIPKFFQGFFFFSCHLTKEKLMEIISHSVEWLVCLVPTRVFWNKSSPLCSSEQMANKWSHISVGVCWKLVPVYRNMHIYELTVILVLLWPKL